MNIKLFESIFIILLSCTIYTSDKIEGIAFPGMHHFQPSKNYDLHVRLLQKLIPEPVSAATTPRSYILKSSKSENLQDLEKQHKANRPTQIVITKTPVSQQNYQALACFTFSTKS